MSQVWAIFDPSGVLVLRYTTCLEDRPEAVGHAEECIGCTVYPIAREPELQWGEIVNPLTGALGYDSTAVIETLVQAVKDRAFVQIEALAPAWRQLNDLRTPTVEGAARFSAVDAIRLWSDQTEAQLRAATSVAELKDAWT